MGDSQVIVALVILKVIILGFISLGACLYALPLCFVQYFHTPLHLLTLNVCIAAFICSTFWAIYFIMNTFYQDTLWTEQSCLPILYVQTTVNCQVLYALCVVSLNRLFSIMFPNKVIFRRRRWVAICVIIQWIFAALIPLPTFASSLMHCFISGLELNYQIYVLIIIAVIPAIFLAITNGLIFNHSHRSTRRVRPGNVNNVQVPVLSDRDAHLLKHMIIMFAVFFFGWVPIYIIAVINWNGNGISYVLQHAIEILPTVSLLIDVLNLFWYNYELRRYLTNRRQNEPPTHITGSRK